MEGKFRKLCGKANGSVWHFAVIALSVVLTGTLLGQTLMAGGFAATARYQNTGFVPQGIAYVEEQLNLVATGLATDSGGNQVYRLNDKNLIAPKPDPAGYGTASSFAELAPVLEGASSLLTGQKLLLTEEDAGE